jgi:hypothetical protein
MWCKYMYLKYKNNNMKIDFILFDLILFFH